MRIGPGTLEALFEVLGQLNAYRVRGRAVHQTLAGTWIVRSCPRFLGWGWDTSGPVVAWSRDGRVWHGEQP